MKVALYYPWIYLKSGVERTILETVRRSRHQYTIFTNHYDIDGTYPEFKRLKVIELEKIPVRRNIYSVFKAALTILNQKIDLTGFDILVVHSEGLGDLIQFKNKNIPVVCFCHTPLRPVFDTDYKKRSRSERPFLRRAVYSFFDIVYKLVDRYFWQNYKYIFFNSKESLLRAKRGGLMNNISNYEVLHPGIDWNGVKPLWEYEKYFLVPGRIMWTKNIELAIESFLIFQKGIKNKDKFKLVIAGQVDEKSRDYFNKLKNYTKESGDILFVENPSDKKLSGLYANCFAALATSFNEDWGITPIEANAYGKPVIAVNNGGFKESQEDGRTGFLVNPNPTEIALKMDLLAKNRKTLLRMGRLARNNSEKFDWTTFIKEFDYKINEIVKK